MMNLKSFVITSVLCGSSILLHAQTKTQTYAWENEKYPRERQIDIERMVINVGFEPAIGKVKGQVTHYFKPLRKEVDSLFFDAPGITIQQVYLNGKSAAFSTNNEGVIIVTKGLLKWETKDSVRIVYEATPQKGIYFIGWNDPNNLSRKQIWTQGQGVDNRYWVPMWDDLNDKMITETIVRFDSKYKVLSNGTKALEKDNKDGTKTWQFKMTKPHSNYLVMLGIGEYDIKEEKSKSGVPLRMYYYPEHKNRVDYTYKHTADIMNFFEKEIGVPYPWESYAQIPVQDFMYGAMENTTATVFGDFFCADSRSYNDRNYVAVNAHEMAHQWFGDMVTARCEPHHWLQESFATHYNLLAEREFFGQDHFDWARRTAQNSALDADSKDSYPVASSQAGSARYYPKGSIVLNTLKYVTGREEYNKAIKHYLQKHAYQNVESNDLLVSFEETLGYSLGWFWEEWLYKAGEPDYDVAFFTSKNEKGQGQHCFAVKQVQDITNYTGLFKMPIVFEVYYKDGSKVSTTQWIESESQMVYLLQNGNKEVDYVLFDPNAEIPKKISFNRTTEMLMAQAEKAANMIDRYDAWLALRSTDISKKRNLLVAQFDKETFHAIKVEILSQLINDEHPASIATINKAMRDKSTEVRKGVIAKMPNITANLKVGYELFLQDSSYDIIASALEKLSAQFPNQIDEYLNTTKNVIGVRSRNVELKWLEVSLSKIGNQQQFNQLVNYTSSSYEFTTRTNAMTVLKKFNYFDANLMDNCFNAMLNPNSRLAGPAAELLKYYRAQYTYKGMIDDKIRTSNWEPFQKEIIKKYL